MKPRNPFEADNPDFDGLDAQIRKALLEEGVIIPKTVEDVRRVKARQKVQPVTIPPHLQKPPTIMRESGNDDSIQVTKIVIPFPVSSTQKSISRLKTRNEFVEAVVIAQLTRLLAKPEWPLGRLRYNKLAYLSHRKAEDDVSEHFLKKAAGPYSPWAKYQGPESIALKNGYVRRAKVGSMQGLVAGDKIEKIDQYLSRYPVCTAVDSIVGKLRFRKNDDLELLATVDFAALDLIRVGTPIKTETIKQVISANKEWAPKLKREIFSDDNITQALAELQGLFPQTYL